MTDTYAISPVSLAVSVAIAVALSVLGVLFVPVMLGKARVW